MERQACPAKGGSFGGLSAMASVGNDGSELQKAELEIGRKVATGLIADLSCITRDFWFVTDDCQDKGFPELWAKETGGENG